MSEAEDQMGLFEAAVAPAAPPPRQPQDISAPSAGVNAAPPPPAAAMPAPRKPAGAPKAAPKAASKAAPKAAPPAPPRKVSGLVPQGDVRLTANIRQDLHLKLKICSAHRRTTIGEILEELIEKHL